VNPHERMAALNAFCLERFERYYLDPEQAEAMDPASLDRVADRAAEYIADVLSAEAESGRPTPRSVVSDGTET
jgi:hypothetical protein